MALWKLHGDGKNLDAREVIAPDERLTWPRTVGIGLQHIVAMFGATFLVPVLTGFPPTTTLFFSAVSTMLFLLITRNKVPSYLGSSFAFISPVVAASSGSMGAALFGIVCTGVLLAVIGLIVMRAGVGWINKLMPPVVTGVIVALIGFNLAPTAYSNFIAQPFLATVTFVTIVLVQALSKGIIGRLSILIGVVVGYAVAGITGEITFESVAEAAWIGLPTFHLPEADFSVLLMFLPVVLVLVAENIGHVKSVATMTGKNLDKSMGRALFSDGIGTTIAGFGGGSGTTTYAENIGVMAATRVYSTAAYWVAGAGALVLSLCPKFGAAIFLIPGGVLGGVCILLYGMIGMLGVRIWVENKVDFSNNVNMVTGAVPLVMGIASFTLFVGSAGLGVGAELLPTDIIIGPIAVASVMALILYHLMIALNKLRGIELPKPVDFKKFEKGGDADASVQEE
ncbi:MAG: NCS2 family nucleobase:cation symporter [Coriobacteriales bacterium]|jgi:uracil-xanthine permease|nr:NCS2 family nucleobase:cation symporter [Coriobacteriales bacterium]